MTYVSFITLMTITAYYYRKTMKCEKGLYKLLKNVTAEFVAMFTPI